MQDIEIRHFHLFGGLGGGAKGFNAASARVGQLRARFRCIGSVDVDPAAGLDFARLAGATSTTIDLMDREQYEAFHGEAPPAGWREATPADIRQAAGGERPHVVFLSAPCKGFSGLLSQTKSLTSRYQALNRLTLRGIWLMLEAWGDDPPELVLFENVPRLQSRGRHLLDQIVAMLQAYGYATAETTHDCGRLGGMAQSRKRFLLVARHQAKVPPFLYEPPQRPLQGVGTVLGRMRLPGDEAAGPMHRVPALQWKTWVRLAFVKAGSDWRSLHQLAVAEGVLRDWLIVPYARRGYLGVRAWDQPVGVVAGESRSSNGAFSVADPRFDPGQRWRDGQAYGVRGWAQPAGTIAGQQAPAQGGYAVADPRHAGPAKHSNEFRVVPWDRSAAAVTSAHGSGQCVADPRPHGGAFAKFPVTPWADPCWTVIAGSTTGQGAFAVADPRPGLDPARAAYLTGGHYGVVPWSAPAGAVSASAQHDQGPWSVADPRPIHVEQGAPPMPQPGDRLVARIVAADGTWHRPFTTLELAALQSLVDPEESLELAGLSDSAWRERIGNAVPPDAAQAIASMMGQTLLLAWSGETFALGSTPIWVREIAVGLSVAQQGGAA